MIKKLNTKIKEIMQNHQLVFLVASFSVIIGLLLASVLIDHRIFGYSVLLGIFGGLSIYIALNYVEYALYFIITWVAFEPFLLKFINPEWFIYIKYTPELLIYALLAILVVKHVFIEKKAFIKTPINMVFIGFIIVACISLILNKSSLFIGVLGIRQLIRFFFVYYLILYSGLQRISIYVMLVLIGLIAGFESFLGIIQYLAGGYLDPYLLPDRRILLGAGIVIEGVEQFWEGGQRIFATFGRYDRLGSFLSICFTLVVALLYEATLSQKQKKWVLGLLIMIGIALLLTYSRASWLSTLIGSFMISLIVKRDKRVVIGIILSGVLLMSYIAYYLVTTRTNLSIVTDLPEATLTERFLEAFSKSSLEHSYEGLGRVYFIINTPLRVIPSAPVFGVGPGYYGGGVAAALGNSKVYNELGLPFGVYGEIGQIDNNWFSIWGETGTVGVLLYMSMFILLWLGMWQVYPHIKDSTDILMRVCVLTSIGIIPAVMSLGLFAPYFEMRTLMIYVMVILGCAYHLKNSKFKY